MLSGLVGQKSFPDSLLTLCNGDLGRPPASNVCLLLCLGGDAAHVMFEALASQVDSLGRWFPIRYATWGQDFRLQSEQLGCSKLEYVTTDATQHFRFRSKLGTDHRTTTSAPNRE